RIERERNPGKAHVRGAVGKASGRAAAFLARPRISLPLNPGYAPLLPKRARLRTAKAISSFRASRKLEPGNQIPSYYKILDSGFTAARCPFLFRRPRPRTAAPSAGRQCPKIGGEPRRNEHGAPGEQRRCDEFGPGGRNPSIHVPGRRFALEHAIKV